MTAKQSAKRPPASALPEPIAPMLATPGNLDMLVGGDWLLEGKWDGVRAVAQIGGGQAILRSRTGRDITAGYPELVDLPELLGGRQVVLDGEIVAMDKTGRTDFGRLQQRIGLTKPADVERVRRTIPVAYLIFDVLRLEGKSLLETPLVERRQILDDLAIAGTFVLVPDQLTGDPAAVLAQTKKDGWEGILAKKPNSTYQPGARSKAWIKVKNELMLEVVVIGWTPGQGRRQGTVGALLLAEPQGDTLVYRGHVGTGFTDRALDELLEMLAPLAQSTPPANVPRPDARLANWVTPTVVGEVVYSEMTHNGTLRHPRWRGIRTDKTVDTISN